MAVLPPLLPDNFFSFPQDTNPTGFVLVLGTVYIWAKTGTQTQKYVFFQYFTLSVIG